MHVVTEKVAQRSGGETRERFRFKSFDEIKPGCERPYLVRGLIPRVGLSVAWGEPASGKSHFTLDLGLHVALGRDYRGRKVEQGAVILIAAEGATGIASRVEAFRQHDTQLAEDTEGVPFYLMSESLDLAKEAASLIEKIKALIEDKGIGRVALIEIDTLNRTFTGSESSDEAMGAYLRACFALIECFACSVLLVHHCGHAKDHPRGHTSLIGSADAMIAVRKTGSVFVATVEKMRDGTEGETVAGRLKPVEVGTDPEGNPITACTVVECDAPEKDTTRPLTKNQATMLTILQSAGRPLSTDDWNEKARAAGLGTKRRADLHDHREALRKKGLVYEGNNGWSLKK